ncbi:MAG: metallophosphoesterase family protein [Oscillospiraceae bacterium]|nr:metallophosphoesterase family protein [Oscillospiraceae bacterium]
MKLLLISDEESPRYWDHYRPGLLKGIDLILSAGDLKAEYLSFLVTMGRAPLLYVHGNHDKDYEKHPPEGCVCIDGDLVTVNGLRILGLGGCRLYNYGAHQYTEKQMASRIRKLRWKLFRSRGVDIVLTHAPPRGLGDSDDPAHQGFESFLALMDRYHPRYLIHGHVHTRYGVRTDKNLRYGETAIINACGYRILEIPDK